MLRCSVAPPHQAGLCQACAPTGITRLLAPTRSNADSLLTRAALIIVNRIDKLNLNLR